MLRLQWLVFYALPHSDLPRTLFLVCEPSKVEAITKGMMFAGCRYITWDVAPKDQACGTC